MSLVPVTSVKYHLTVPSFTCVEHLLIHSAALLYDVANDMSVVQAACSKKTTTLTRTITCRLSQKTNTATATGSWISCIRLLKQGASPCLVAVDPDAHVDECTALEESWMETADLTLLTILRDGM
jgi:hypothetical protein